MRTRAFTLMELTVVLVLVIISAMMVAPAVTSFLQNREEHDFIAKLEKLAVDERQKARSDKTTKTLRFDEAARAFREEKDANIFATIPDGATASEARVDGKVVAADEWTVKFFSDGTATLSQITLMVGGKPWSLEISKDASISVRQKTLPEAVEADWEAGDYVQRG